MLDTETKRRIDTARDILVGKVPDPKSQVEQITIALIYKFMNDMDAQAEELGGARTFFAGEFEKYSWSKLLAVGMGGYDVVTLYGEAIARMTENQGIPALFRDIFKNAYLPYRDPETLKAFLKIIDDFSYDHSERLGDAFEYLLSVLGSQGDAGQFRTPRHIIDFMVDVIDPQKNETILDPACGTAGFLISAYKHILNANALDGRPGALITPDERARLTKNIKGYDISPDMVRLSLVNLYLHGFADPHIFEYDTLTSEDRWNEYADVIMANPPFMSPKGGIRPHKRFSVQSSRSEVLFVDYIAEHLTANGRAAVVVPEGIIFQSGSAYKSLRKTLVDNNYLVGVISLPAGVFNPYAGVKTSILWLDRALATKTDQILFVKIESDGFDLGAQRREIKQNDLPQMLSVIEAYKTALASGKIFEAENPNVTLVEKARLGESGDYNLSGERYRTQIKTLSEYKLVKLEEVCSINANSANPQEYFGDSQFVYIDISSVENEIGTIRFDNIVKTSDAPSRARRLVKNGEVIISTVRPNLKAFAYLENLPDRVIASTGFAVLSPKENLNGKFLFHVLRNDNAVSQMIDRMGRGSYPSINQEDVSEIQIPLPPLDIQQQIVAEIDGYQKIIDGARQVVDNYQPRIEIDPAWEMVAFEQACELNPKKSEVSDLPQDTLVSFVPMADLNENNVEFVARQEKPIADVLQGYTYFRDNDVLLARVTPCFENGKAGIAKNLKNGIGFGSSEYYVFRPNERILPLWIYLCVTTEQFRQAGVLRMTGTGGLQRVPKDFVLSYPIPFPDLATQQRIVAQIEHEQALVKSTNELVALFEKKIQERIARVWGE